MALLETTTTTTSEPNGNNAKKEEAAAISDPSLFNNKKKVTTRLVEQQQAEEPEKDKETTKSDDKHAETLDDNDGDQQRHNPNKKDAKEATSQRTTTPATTTRSKFNRRTLIKSVCQSNPFKGASTKAFRRAAMEAQDWLENLQQAARDTAERPEMSDHTHDRFFPFIEMAPCNEKNDISCIGGRGDEKCGAGHDKSKIACGLNHLPRSRSTGLTKGSKMPSSPTCIVYAIGSSKDWHFEMALSNLTECEIHTFDCTGPRERFVVPEIDNLHFHHVCIGAEHEDAAPPPSPDEKKPKKCKKKCGETWTLEEARRKLNHERIDLLKMDIEGWEWPLLESWLDLGDPGADRILLPMQVLVEVHYRTQFPELSGFDGGIKRHADYDWKFARDVVDLQEHLIRVGYTVAVRHDNSRCKHCSELTLIRTSCPSTGVYSQIITTTEDKTSSIGSSAIGELGPLDYKAKSAMVEVPNAAQNEEIQDTTGLEGETGRHKKETQTSTDEEHGYQLEKTKTKTKAKIANKDKVVTKTVKEERDKTEARGTSDGEQQRDPVEKDTRATTSQTTTTTKGKFGSKTLLRSTCHGNPFKGAIQATKSFKEVAADAQDWLKNLPAAKKIAKRPEMMNHTHDRFFPFIEMAPCNEKYISCIGAGDCTGQDKSKSKKACGLNRLPKKRDIRSNTRSEESKQQSLTPPPCIIYAVGSTSDWHFEMALRNLTECEIHAFDCTGPRERFVVPENVENLVFHHVCIGAEHEDAAPPGDEKCKKCGETWTLEETQRKLNHERIDLLMMDVEGWEWPLLESWLDLGDPGADQILLPMQVLVEVHYRTQFPQLIGGLFEGRGEKKVWEHDWKSAQDVVDLQEHLIRVGYTVSVRDDNSRCKHCSELTLIRTSCPSTGVYSQLHNRDTSYS